MDNIGESLNQIRQLRIDKLNKLRELGFDPFPARVARDKQIGEVIENFDKLIDTSINLVGRCISKRSYGKLLFLDLKDESGKIQLILLKQIELIDPTNFKSLNFDQAVELIDNGDFLEVVGKIILSKTNEKSIQVNSIRIITKSIRPIPETLDDVEIRQRKRYLDILVHPEVKARFERRSKFWQAMREFLISKGFLEMNNPILEHTTGGADANPFVTHMDAIDQDFYLRISHELPLKRLIGAGYEKVFDMGARFRNEGFSDEHMPEHIGMEWYWAYADYKMGMDLVREMFIYIAQKVYGKTKFTIRGFEVDFESEWKEVKFTDIMKNNFGIDCNDIDDDKIKSELKKNNIVMDVYNAPRGMDKLWKTIRGTLGGPFFLTSLPKELMPLSKLDKDNPAIVEFFTPLIAGSELGKGYSELNDPILQSENFKEQQALQNAGDNEAQMFDHDFVEMLEYGMPPTCGFGTAERTFWFLENISAREGVIFPPMKAEQVKEKTTRLAVVMLNKSANLQKWQELNAVAHLTGSLVGRNKNNFSDFELRTSDNKKIDINPTYAILIKETENQTSLINLKNKIENDDSVKSYIFIREMIESSDDKKIAEILKNKSFEELEILGMIVYGEIEKIKTLTSEFKMFE